MEYHNDVSVIVEDDLIKVLDENGVENSIIFLKSNSNNKYRILDNRTHSSSSIIFKNESYIERLYEDSLKEIKDFDRMAVKESFAKEIYHSEFKRPSLLNILKFYFFKKK